MRNGALVMVMVMGVLACGAPATTPKAPAGPPPTSTTATSTVNEPARSPLVALLDGYTFDEGVSGPTETQVIDALHELTRAHQRSPLGADERRAVLQLFLRLRASLPKAKVVFRPVNAAVVAIADPGWEDALIARLEVPIVSARTEHTNALIDQAYWQITAAQTLGRLKSEKAIPALLRVLLSPFKDNVEGTARAALTRIGRAVIPVAKRLVEGGDSALMAYAESEFLRGLADEGEPIDDGARLEAKEAHVDVGLTVLADLGTTAAGESVVSALTAPSKATRQRAAAELYKLPKTPALVEAFKRIYRETVVVDQLRDGDYAKEALLSCASNLFEPGLAAWLVDDALQLPTGSADTVGVQAAVLSLALRAVPKAEWPKAEKLFQRLASRTQGKTPAITAKDWAPYQKAHDEATALLARCGDDAACHRAVLVEPAHRDPTSMTTMRAATMAMLLGHGEQAVPLWQKVTLEEPRNILGAAIAAYSPAGNIEAAAAFEAALREAQAGRDAEQIARIEPFAALAAILRARAER